MSESILITGKNGQVGWELQRTLAPLGDIVAVDIENVDLINPAAVRELIRATKPDLLVNPAAYTAVDLAEQEEVLAHQVNAVAPGIMAEEARRLNIPILHYSTDYIFDGAKTTPYDEEDRPNPLNIYGRTKLAGEEKVIASGARYVILRLGWVYGSRGKNFLLTMLRLGNERQELRVVDDQIGAPTWCRMIAEATAHIARVMLDGGGDWEGIYHLTAGGKTTWYGFAGAIFTSFSKSIRQAPTLLPITTADYQTAAQRPSYSILSNNKLYKQFGIRLPNWEKQLHLLAEEQ